MDLIQAKKVNVNDKTQNMLLFVSVGAHTANNRRKTTAIELNGLYLGIAQFHIFSPSFTWLAPSRWSESKNNYCETKKKPNNPQFWNL